MKSETYAGYSHYLKREMSFSIYGHSGKLLLAFPTQNGRHWDYAGFGMIDALHPWIDDGQLTVACADSIDLESWSNVNHKEEYRIEMQEMWYHYVMDEMLPYVWEITGSFQTVMATGCSMGAYHAANFFFRRPDIFDTLIALSGFYRASLFFGDYMDDRVYANSPEDFIRGMPDNHPYIPLYNKRDIIICIGQGPWEDELLLYTRGFDRLLKEKGIHAWFDYWGYDVSHDWLWWRKQIVYFLEKLLPLQQ